MQLEEPALEKDVIDYDFLFSHGIKLPLTLDPAAGDHAVEEQDRFVITLAAKPSRYNPEETLCAEVASVYKANILALVIRNRKQRVPTPEEQFDMRQTVQKLSKVVQ